MKTLKFKIQIKATPEKVWTSLWDEENYKKWTNPFCKGSHYKTRNFAEGSKIHLLTPDGNGMYSIIERLEVNKFLSFRHQGNIVNFEEQPIDKETQVWTNALENYRLTSLGKETELEVSVDTIDQYVDFMNKTFPKALDALKKLAEYEE